jgi:hypothetical protein
MSTQKHEQDAKREQAATNVQASAQQHGESARQEQAKERAHDHRTPAERLEHVADRQAKTRATMEYLSVAASAAKEELEKASRRVDNARPHADTFTAGAGDARATLREAADEARRREADQLAERAKQALAAAAGDVIAVAASMRERFAAHADRLDTELTEAAAKATRQDQRNLSPAEAATRGATRDETVDDRLAVLAQRQRAEVERVGELIAETRKASLAFARDAQALLAQNDAAGLERLRERTLQFSEQHRDTLALRNVWDGRFADIEAVKRTWERAAEGQPASSKGYDAARGKFWEAVNTRRDADARAVHALLDRVGVEWQEGKKAPYLAVQSARMDGMRALAERGDRRMQEAVQAEREYRLITIDHVADKGTHQDLALDPRNLRFLVNGDNSARGNHYDAADRWNLDFKRTQEQQATNKERREERRGERADQAHEVFEAFAVARVRDRLTQEQARADVAHAKELREAAANHDSQAAQLRDSRLHRMKEPEGVRRDAKPELGAQLDAFLAAGRAQREELQRAERSLHTAQAQELGRLEARLAADRTTLNAKQAVDLVKAADERLAAQRAALATTRDELERRRAADEGAMLRAIYESTTRTAQLEAVARAIAQQEETRREQAKRVAELERERGADD